MLSANHHGFTVIAERELPELAGVLYHMRHEKTGLELVWLKRDEENKTFGIAFETLPWDDTGVFHILEHSVLCGSDKYPVKEPFVELMKSSMKTFLNALTFQDKTFYPVSSRNDKDFINLTRVYLDAVFHPLIYSKPEIFYQEGWHYEFDEQGNPSYKGVVFNEMKGAFASADRQVFGGVCSLLFPQTPYRFVSGGDPASIPDLTYETFLDSHRRFYAPSNAYVFLDGDVNIDEVLGILDDEYLCHYEKTERMAPPAMQTPVSAQAEDYYEIAPGEDPQGKTRLSYGKVICNYDDRETSIAMEVLAEVLCGSNQSPLTKAVLSEGLAEEVSLRTFSGVLQPWVLMDVKNIREENIEKVEHLIASQLEKLASEGLDHEQLEAVMANLEFKMRERDYGYYPQGIVFGFSVLESWLYGGDPALNLEIGTLFADLRAKMHEGYFENLLRKMLLENPHSAKLILHPSHSVGDERRAKEQARLTRESSSWTQAERDALHARQDTLIAWQESEDTPEKLATIPRLALEDIPSQPEEIPTEVMQIDGINVIRHDLHTGGIAYVSLYFDADSCTEEELSCLSFACSLLGESDTALHSAEEIVNKTRRLCGNFRVSPTSYTVDGDLKNVTVKLCVSFSALEENLSEALAHIAEIVTQSRFRDETTHDILRQAKMAVFQGAVMGGDSIALNRVRAQFTPSGVVDESIGGVSYYNYLKNADENWDFASLNEKINALLLRLINKNTLTLSVSGTDAERTTALAHDAAAVIAEHSCAPKAEIKPWGKRKEGIAIPADIAFAAAGGSILENGGHYCGQMQLASQIIRLAYLWNVIRVQGGAYGTGMVAWNSGIVGCYSYRDPNGAASLERYRESAAFLRNFAQNTTDFTGFIIGAVASASPLRTPSAKASAADGQYFTNNTFETRCQIRRQLLSATSDDLIAIADVLEKTICDAGICLIGGQAQLDKCTELESIVTL